MEILLTKNSQDTIDVTCDGQFSHVFRLSGLLPEQHNGQIVLTDPGETGTKLFQALFANGTPARAAWDKRPKRILLVADDAELDAVPWEYLYGPDGFIVLDVAFVRGLPASQRQPALNLAGTPLHIVAVPSNPIAHEIDRLDIEGEWIRLTESLHELETSITLERVRPPTLDQTRRLVANQRNRVLHFMGHGDHNGKDSCLVFEDERGAPKPTNAQEFIRRLEDTAFLVTLNACVSATPGETEFSNLARALTQKGVPYALGMRFSIPDDDAKAFSRTFYDELARGSSVENALRLARNSLFESKNPWAVGTPVLYTSLNEAAEGFETPSGKPHINEHQPHLEVFALPRTEGAFQGRADELLTLGKALTSEPRAKLLTIHGPGGQGKTALVREAAERFAHAWPGGVWAVSLEHNPVLDRFTLELARYFKIDLDGIYKQVASAHPNLETNVFQGYVQQELERRILAVLNRERVLLVLDNAETFVEAVEAKDKTAIDLAVFLREKVLSTQASLLLTSRNHLGWTGEQALELAGLSDDEGARLFWQSAPGRSLDAIGPLAQEISHKVEGHPLSLRLLGGAFDASKIPLEEFVHLVEDTLLQAEDKYKHEDHRHRTLYASIETSARYLDEAQRALLSGLWIFKSPFQPETAGQVFALPNRPEAKIQQEQIAERLHTLFRRGLLVREVEMLSGSNILLYRSLPTVRLFSRHYLEQMQSVETLQAQMGNAYAALLQNINRQIDRNSWASYLAVRCRKDLEACAEWVETAEQGWYANHLGRVLHRIGDLQAAKRWLEKSLERAQGMDPELESNIINNMALVYSDTGQPGNALKLFEQALPIVREVGDRAGEATTLNNMAAVYGDIGQPVKALELYEQALPLRRAVGDRAGEATTLNNMALVYSKTGQLGKALELSEQALPIVRNVGDWAGEAAILNSMALVYSATGWSGKALELSEQALPIVRAVGDRAGEATTLNNMAAVYSASGQSGKALELYEQALPMHREVGNRAIEATTLNNMAAVYGDIGQPVKALELYEQALPLRRAVGDRAGEATTLNNMALMHSDAGLPGKALELYDQALPITREVGDLAGEATILNNTALVYSAMGQPGRALELFEQALPMRRAVGDRIGEANTLNNMARVYCDTGEPGRALELFEQALPILQTVGDLTGVAKTMTNISVLLYSDLSRPQEAIDLLKQAIIILQKLGLNQYVSGATISQMQSTLEMMQSSQPLSGTRQASIELSNRLVETLVSNTIIALTDIPEKRDKWRKAIAGALGQAQSGNMQVETEFLTAILALLDSETPVLLAENPYTGALQTILQRLSDRDAGLKWNFAGDNMSKPNR